MTHDDPWPLQVECGNAWALPPQPKRPEEGGSPGGQASRDVTPHNLLSRTSPQGLLTVTECSRVCRLPPGITCPAALQCEHSYARFSRWETEAQGQTACMGQSGYEPGLSGSSVPERQGWVVGLQDLQPGSQIFPGSGTGRLVRISYPPVVRRRESHAPLWASSFPFYKGSKDAELLELSWSLGLSTVPGPPGIGALATPAPT